MNPQPRKIWAEALVGTAKPLKARHVVATQIRFDKILLKSVRVCMIRILSFLDD